MSESHRKPWDFFISYASEDRDAAATPLKKALDQRGFSVWLDQQALTRADSLEHEIEQGLMQSHAGIVIVSPQFVRKDWPMRELDALLRIEAIDGRHKVIPVLHNLTAGELAQSAPPLLQRAAVSTADGFEVVCDRILALVLTAADRELRTSLGDVGVAEMPRFRSSGFCKCPNPDCSWRAPHDLESMFGVGFDPGPEFTLEQKGSQWCIVCGACGAAVGSLTSDEAKKLATMLRVSDMWAPRRAGDNLLAAQDVQEREEGQDG